MEGKGKILIRGGTVVDPASDMFGKADVLIHNDKIITAVSDGEADKVIDAAGCLVLPGLIDYHAHLFFNKMEIGVNPDLALLPQGVTTAVDQGSAGITNAAEFLETVIDVSQVRVFAHLHVSPAGLATLPDCLENVDPSLYDLQRSRDLIAKHDRLVGLKIRQSKEIVGDWGLEPLKATIRMAEAIGCPVVVHTTNPPGDVDEMVSLLRPGDVFTHVYQGKGSTILDGGGAVRLAVRAARERGVIFDTADGRGHYAFSVAKAAIGDGFLPDVISTDVVRSSLFEPTVFGLPLIMSKYLALGMSLPDVVGACTANPAKLLGMQGQIGTLAPGAFADVAIFKLKDSTLQMRDVFGDALTCGRLFVPQLTMLSGKVVYRSIEL